MILDLKEVFAEQGKVVPFDYNVDLSSTEVDSAHPFVSPVHVTGTVTGWQGFADLKAKVSFDFSIPCDRCTAQIDRRCTYTFTHVLVHALENAEDDRYVEVRDDRLDLDSLLREDILLELPTKFLCREDCRGICPVCGKNLNEGPCGCVGQDVDPRLETLKNLLN